jgi:hypothetical protein
MINKIKAEVFDVLVAMENLQKQLQQYEQYKQQKLQELQAEIQKGSEALGEDSANAE